MDTVNKTTRSKIMSKVKSKGTKLEEKFRKLLWGEGVRYTKNNDHYFGKPDLLIKGKKVVIFVDSCFWHGCKDHLRMPQSNLDYWAKKIKRNKERDSEVNKYYKENGWRVLRFWEHDLKDEKEIIKKLKRLRKV
jgi:DNA mismatch endonuclease (patch repair protein)